MEKRKIKKSFFDTLLKNKTNRMFVYLILVFAAYILFISQLNLSVAKIGANVVAGNSVGSSGNLISLPAGASESKIVSAMLPQDNEIGRASCRERV